MIDSTKSDVFRQGWYQKTGELPFPMTNDYLFRALCQKDSLALRSLICSVLRWDDEQVVSAEVTNPILLGRAIDDKEFVLDVHVMLGDNITINLEMQVVNYNDWPERSLQYLCRRYDELKKGEDYEDSKTAIHIGLLSFDPFEGRSRLRESYRILSEETGLLYTDKFQLYVLCLPQAGRTVEEDIRHHTDAWAEYFMAKTWEDLKMAAAKEAGIASAVATVNKLWEDEDIRARMQAREDYERRERAREAKIRRTEEELAQAREDYERHKNAREAKLRRTEEELAQAREDYERRERAREAKIRRAQESEKRIKAEIEQIKAEAESKYREEKKRNEDLQAEIERLRRELKERSEQTPATD